MYISKQQKGIIIESKYSKKALFLYLLLLLPLAALFFISYIIIDTNRGNLDQYDLIIFLMLFLWFPTMFLYMILQQYKEICVTGEKIIIRRYLGLSMQSFRFEEIRRADYFYGSHGIVLQPLNGEQITLGAREYENYSDLIRVIAPVVQMDSTIRVQYFTKGLKLLTGIGGTLLFLFIINRAF